MDNYCAYLLIILLSLAGCRRSTVDTESSMRDSSDGALLLTRYKTLEELKSVVDIQYVGEEKVMMTCRSREGEVVSILKSGINEGDFLRARGGKLWDQVRIVFMSPWTLLHRDDLVRVEILGRRRYELFGEGDIAFYDIAEAMVYNIADDDLLTMPVEDLSEKGYLNTFNHVVAQAFMTSLFSERLADFIADVHERHRMPELITGKFTSDQMTDLADGPLDNYLDIINNEWGQELGKELNEKYKLSPSTHWTPTLLACYLNDIQSYHSWAFRIGFKPFLPDDDLIVRFAKKINSVKNDMGKFRKYYY